MVKYPLVNYSGVPKEFLPGDWLPIVGSANILQSNADGSLNLSETGVAPGTYNTVTVDVYGRVISATNVTGGADIAHSHGIANGAGVLQFSYGVDENVLFAAGGSIGVAFDAATKKVTYSAPTLLSAFTNDPGYITSAAHSHGIADGGGTQKFTYAIGENVRFEGSGNVAVTFDAATKKVIISGSAGTGADGNTYVTAIAFNAGVLTLTRNDAVTLNTDIPLSQLKEVVITTLANGDMLTYNGTNWVNGPQPTLPVYTADNGLTMTVRNTQLGGPLLHDTHLTQNFNLSIDDGTFSAGAAATVGNARIYSISGPGRTGVAISAIKSSEASGTDFGAAVTAQRAIPDAAYASNSVQTAFYGEINVSNTTGFDFTGRDYVPLSGVTGVFTIGSNTGAFKANSATFSGVYGYINVGGSGTIDKAAGIRAGYPLRNPNINDFTGTITNYYGIYIDDLGLTSYTARITNRYAFFQSGANDISVFNGNLKLAKQAGTGTRMLVVDASGNVSNQAIPAGGSGGGTVTSISQSITASTALLVNNGTSSTINTSGTFALSWAGNSGQYVRGDGALATFPTNISAFSNNVGYITSSNFGVANTANAVSFYVNTGENFQFGVSGTAGISFDGANKRVTFSSPSNVSSFNNDMGYITNAAHSHNIGNSAGTLQFSFGVGDMIRFAGQGNGSVSFDSATKKITFSAPTVLSSFSNDTGFITGVTVNTSGGLRVNSVTSATGTTFNLTFAGATTDYIRGDGSIAAFPASTGEANTGANLGSGAGVFYQKAGVQLQFNSIKAGNYITLDTSVLGEIKINGTAPGEVNVGNNVGIGTGIYYTKSLSELQFKTIKAGTNVTFDTTTDARTIIINASGGGSGEANTASNVGGYAGVYYQKTGVNLELRTLAAGYNMSVAASGDHINIGTNFAMGSAPLSFDPYNPSYWIQVVVNGNIYVVPAWANPIM